MNKLILASQSPRREELLRRITDNFEIVVSEKPEILDENLSIDAQIMSLAKDKAEAVLKQYPEAVVIGADTVIILDHQVIGKPQDKEDARRIIKLLMNRTHEVITGVCVMTEDRCELFSETCKVTVEALDSSELEYYLDHESYMDKSGAYAIQGAMSKYISAINGDINTVIGLPVHKLYKVLKTFDVL